MTPTPLVDIYSLRLQGAVDPLDGEHTLWESRVEEARRLWLDSAEDVVKGILAGPDVPKDANAKELSLWISLQLNKKKGELAL